MQFIQDGSKEVDAILAEIFGFAELPSGVRDALDRSIVTNNSIWEVAHDYQATVAKIIPRPNWP